jgi:hypothetical protein
MGKCRNAVLVFLILSFPLFGNARITDVKKIREEARSSRVGKKWSLIELDRNNDGRTDHVMLLDERGGKVYEELDFNFDGEMDDFCFYTAGTLVREEIDSNFDGQIDIWVYLKKGIYVERYERDTNFDGKIDIVKKYGPQK